MRALPAPPSELLSGRRQQQGQLEDGKQGDHEHGKHPESSSGAHITAQPSRG